MRFLWLAAVPFAAAASADMIEPVFETPDAARVNLGWQLFYDPILSGNRNTSCATCHHPRFGTSDGVSLSLGEGAMGLGPERKIGAENVPEQRIPRNAPALFNLGADEFSVMFHDGRLEADASQPDGMRTPLGSEMLAGFDGVLSAQAMFPVLSGDEMAGHYSENEVAQAVRLGFLSSPGGAWDRIAARVAEVPEYRAQFDAVLGQGTEIGFPQIANVIADFIAVEWRADDSDFDRYLRDGAALDEAAERGRVLFYGAAGCGGCHTGWFQTDHGFHAIAWPQVGPGKAARFENHARDVGRMRVTGLEADAYAFRTPSLRNVTKTGPYGHNGAFATLEAAVRHHLDPVASLQNYDREQVVFLDLDGASDWKATDDAAETARIAAANVLEPVVLDDGQVADILSFLEALTDDRWQVGRLGVPDTVPSGFPVDR
ncbi:MAG: cytochrome-c peroxidase [Pelagimonas sp.]|uniref:cytochrome-c peroxidase n=1 Tax=Pelagimonas sp. TaxID=2073170 RepID=UPI003D6C4010